MCERLHIDELKRVEKQVNNLIKMWRGLKKKHEELTNRYEKTSANLEQQKQKHLNEMENVTRNYEETISALKDEWQTRYDDNQLQWQTRYDEDKNGWQEEKIELEQLQREKIDAIENECASNCEKLQRELQSALTSKQILIDRVRGVSGAENE